MVPNDATIEALKIAGNYGFQSDYTEQFLTDERFKVTVHGPRNLFLAHFNKEVDSEHLEAVAREMDFKMTLVEDSLSVSAHPEHRRPPAQLSYDVY